MKTLQKSEQIKESHQKQDFPLSRHSNCLLSVHWRLWHDTDFWSPKLLIKLFLGEMNSSLGWGGPGEDRCWKESLNFTSYATHRRLLWDEKRRVFMPPSKPLTRHEKIWHQSWQKHTGEMNDAIVAGKHQSCSILWGKQCIFLFEFPRWQTTLVAGLTLSIPITQILKQIRIKL